MPHKVIGIDSGNHSTKVIEIERSLTGFEIRRAFTIPAEHRLTADFLSSNGFEHNVWTFFPLKDTTSRLIRLPFSNPTKLEKVIPFELEGEVPFSNDEMVVSYYPLERSKTTTKVLAVGAMREKVRQFLKEINDSGLNPKGVSPEGFSYCLLPQYIQNEPPTIFLFLDIGASHSLIILGASEKTIGARSVPIGGNDITHEIQKELKVDFEEAEKIKIAGESDVVFSAAEKILKPLGVQTLNFIRYFQSTEGIAAEKIYLCGGSAKLPHIERILGDSIGIPIELPIFKKLGEVTLTPEYAKALALTLEDLQLTTLNLRKGEFVYRSKSTILRKKLIPPVALLVSVIFILGINSLAKNKTKQVELATLKAQTSAIAKSLFPNEKISPKEALKSIRSETEKLKKLGEALGELGGLTPLELLTAISEHIPQDVNVDLEQVNMTEKAVILEGIINEHSDMDKILEHLKKFKPFKKFDTPELKTKVGGGVRFTLRIFLTEEKFGEEGG